MKAEIYYNRLLAGYLEKQMGRYDFYYDSQYLQSSNPSISFSFPKSAQLFQSNTLFPFFSGLLAEGTNKEIQCKAWRIDENDDFERLLKTATSDTIGAVTVKEI
jgi:HipA-like protein